MGLKRNRGIGSEISVLEMFNELKVSAYHYTIAHTEGNKEFWNKEVLRQATDLFEELSDADRRYVLKSLPEIVAVDIVEYFAQDFNDPDEFLTDCKDYGLNATERIMQLVYGKKFNGAAEQAISSFEEVRK